MPKLTCNPYTQTKIIGVKLSNSTYFTPSCGESVYLDVSGYYVVEKIGLDSRHGSASVITHVWSKKDIKDILICKNKE